MNNIIVNDNFGVEYKRISKSAALKNYMVGNTVCMIACKLHPFNMWMPCHKMNRRQASEYAADEEGVKNYFNTNVNSYEFYNCNAETGYYTAFYIKA